MDPCAGKGAILAECKLAAAHSGLMARVLAIEAAAAPGLTSVKGLGRRFAWRELLSDPSSCRDALTPETCSMCADEGDAS